MKLPVLLPLSALILSCAFPGVNVKKPDFDKFSRYVNQYVYDGHYIICIKDSAHRDDPNGCNHFDEIGFDITLPQLQRMFGRQEVAKKNDDGSEPMVFTVDSSEAPPTYLMVTFKNSRPVILQLTGPYCTRNISFSGITLGSKSSLVLKTLGPPFEKKKNKNKNGELWDYNPFRFSFEIVNDCVYSIKLVTEAQ
ncbi:MAG TPA: hypothetical protein VLX68_01575 [Chitinivibrionales bacterium]|nr:hypothetical protein [Chitinivibrionales bacterium]